MELNSNTYNLHTFSRFGFNGRVRPLSTNMNHDSHINVVNLQKVLVMMFFQDKNRMIQTVPSVNPQYIHGFHEICLN